MAHIIDTEYLKSVPFPMKDVQWDKIDPNFLEEVVDAAGDFLEDYLDRCVHIRSYTERIVGTNRPVIILNQYPIVSLTSVTELDETEGAVIRSPSEFVIHADAGMIEWKDKFRNYFTAARVYSVTYVAGYAQIPKPLKLATALQAYEMLQPVMRGSRDMSPVDMVPGTSEKFVELTEKYRRKRIA